MQTHSKNKLKDILSSVTNTFPSVALIPSTRGLIQIIDLKEGDKLLSDNKELVTVAEITSHDRAIDLYRITLEGGKSFDVAEDYVLCGKYFSSKGQKEVLARQFMHSAVGDYKFGRKNRIKLGINLQFDEIHGSSGISPSESSLIAWIQLSSILGSYGLVLKFKNEDQKRFLIDIIQELFPNEKYRLIRKTIRVAGDEVNDFISKYDLTKEMSEEIQNCVFRASKSAIIPICILRASKSAIASYLQVFYDFKGYAQATLSNHAIALVVTSHDQAQILSTFLAYFGIQSSISSHRRTSWVVYIRIFDARMKFSEIIGFISKKKIAKLQENLAFVGKEPLQINYKQIKHIRVVFETSYNPPYPNNKSYNIKLTEENRYYMQHNILVF